jgi:hypothetical protein
LPIVDSKMPPQKYPPSVALFHLDLRVSASVQAECCYRETRPLKPLHLRFETRWKATDVRLRIWVIPILG